MFRYLVFALIILATSQLANEIGTPPEENFLGASYDIGQPDKNIPSTILAKNIDFAVATLSFDARIDGSGYGNFFQTSDGLSAIRMEIQPSQKVFLIQPGTELSEVSFPWRLGKWNHYDIQIDRNVVEVRIDGRFALRVKRVPNVSFDHIVIGSGLSRTRHFDGAINNSIFTIRHYATINSDAVLCLAALLSAALLFGMALFLEQEPFPRWALGGTAEQAGAAGVGVLLGLSLWLSGSILWPKVFCIVQPSLVLAVLIVMTSAFIAIAIRQRKKNLPGKHKNLAEM